MVEHAAVPSAHLMIRDLITILHIVLLKNFRRLLEKVHVNPRRSRPVILWYGVIVAFCICSSLSLPLELFCEGDIIEEGPWVVELAVPRPLEIVHRRDKIVQFFVSHQR